MGCSSPEELSRLAPAVAELTPPAELRLHPDDAASLGIVEGQEVELTIDEGGRYRLRSRLDDSVAPGVLAVSSGYSETEGITSLSRSVVTKP